MRTRRRMGGEGALTRVMQHRPSHPYGGCHARGIACWRDATDKHCARSGLFVFHFTRPKSVFVGMACDKSRFARSMDVRSCLLIWAREALIIMTAGIVTDVADWRHKDALASDVSFPFRRGHTLITTGRKFWAPWFKKRTSCVDSFIDSHTTVPRVHAPALSHSNSSALEQYAYTWYIFYQGDTFTRLVLASIQSASSASRHVRLFLPSPPN